MKDEEGPNKLNHLCCMIAKKLGWDYLSHEAILIITDSTFFSEEGNLEILKQTLDHLDMFFNFDIPTESSDLLFSSLQVVGSLV